MDNIIEMARKLGEEIQKDERYLKVQMAQIASDEDDVLQNLISEFNLKRVALNREMAQENKDEEKVKELDREVREIYVDLMGNENMLRYQEARSDFDKIIQDAISLVTRASQGEDISDFDPDEFFNSCSSGGCSSCSGCH